MSAEGKSGGVNYALLLAAASVAVALVAAGVSCEANRLARSNLELIRTDVAASTRPTLIPVRMIERDDGERLTLTLRNASNSPVIAGVVAIAPLGPNQDVGDVRLPTCQSHEGQDVAADHLSYRTLPPMAPGEFASVDLRVGWYLPQSPVVCAAALYLDPTGRQWVSDWSAKSGQEVDAEHAGDLADLQTYRAERAEWWSDNVPELLPGPPGS